MRAACGGPLGALQKAPPPGPHRTARAACSLTEAPWERPGCAERRAGGPPGCALPWRLLGPARRSPSPPLRPPPGRAQTKPRQCGGRIRARVPDCPGFSRKVTLPPNCPHPYRPRDVYAPYVTEPLFKSNIQQSTPHDEKSFSNLFLNPSTYCFSTPLLDAVVPCLPVFNLRAVFPSKNHLP